MTTRPTNHPVAFNRPLDELEKSLILYLAIRSVAEQMGASEQAAADALDHFAGEGRSILRYDAFDAYLIVAGNVLIHAERDWLAFHAHAPQWN